MVTQSQVVKACRVGWLLHHLYTIYYNHFMVDYTKTTDHRIIQIKEYSLRYLTTWNFIVQTLFLILAVVIDNYPKHNKLHRDLERVKGYIYYTFLAPSTFFVSTMFWAIYHIDRELVYPAECDSIIPSWLNHCTHTNIMGVLLVEAFLGDNLLPSFKDAFIGLSVFSLAYDIVYLYTFFSAGKWLYSLYYFLEWHERILFMIFTYVISVIIMRGGMLVENYRAKIKHLKVF